MFAIFQQTTHRLAKRQAEKVMNIIPLENAQILVITSNKTVTHYQLPKGIIIKQLQLNSQPRRAIALTSNSVLLLMPEQKVMLEMNLSTYEIKIIIKFDQNSLVGTPHNLIREKEYLTTIFPISFDNKQNFFFREEKVEERQVRLRYFQKSNNEWVGKMKDLGNSCSLLQKFNQQSKIALFKQEILQNGYFKFRVFDIEGDDQEMIFESASFTAFTIVKHVKAVNKYDTIICLNHRQPEILYFHQRRQQNSQKIKTQLLKLIPSEQHFITIRLCLSQNNRDIMQLRDQELRVCDLVQGNLADGVFSRKGNWMIQFQREKDPSSLLNFRSRRIIKKEMIYMHLVSNLPLKTNLNASFNNLILQMLRQI